MSLLKKVESLLGSITPKKYYYLLSLSTLLHLLLIFIYSTYSGTDGYIYQRVAHQIISSVDPLYCGALEGAYWPPLFPFYLAAFISFFGENQYLFFIGNLIIALLTTIISAKFLSKIFNQKVALWSTFFYFNSLMMYNFTHYYKYELISGLLVALSLYLIIRNIKRYDLPLAGIFLSMAILANGRLIALVPPIIFYLYKKYREQNRIRVKQITLFLLFLVITILPWTVRNYVCYDKIIFLSTNSGINMYIGFNPQADGGFVTQDKFVEPYNQLDRTDYMTYTKGAVDFIIAHPGQTVVLTLKKISKLWRIHYTDTLLFYPFFYLGIFILLRINQPEKQNESKLIQLIFLFFTIFHLFFFAREYYLLPIAPLLYATAVGTQQYFWNKYISPKLAVK